METYDPPLDLTPIPAGGTLPPAPIAPDITAADRAEETDREEAFAEDPTWNGQLLHPFSIERYSIFLEQRVHMGSPRLHRTLLDGNAFFPDALRILWLCYHPPEILRTFRREPEAMQAAIEAWAAIHAPIPRATDVVTTGIQIFNAAQINQHEVRHAENSATGSTSGN